MTDKTGGAAFPTIEHVIDPRSAGFAGYHGMTLRDYFAAKAMQSLLVTDGTIRFGERAKEAYEMADAMLAERDKT
jgi:hypothetical protein